MFVKTFGVMAGLVVMSVAVAASEPQGRGGAQVLKPTEKMIRTLVGRLRLEDYKATIKDLTQFGDRREGTQRNRDAVDWIAAQLESYGCQPERMTYEPPAPRGTDFRNSRGGGRGGQRGQHQPDATPTPSFPAFTRLSPPATLLDEPVRNSAGGSTLYGILHRTPGNNNPYAQRDATLRELNSGPVIPGPIPQVYCTKVGTTHPDEMYIIGAHMDGIGYGEAANDNGSGTAIVMLLAKIFSASDVMTERSIRFALWNGEEGGLRGATAYVKQRRALQGKEDPPGSSRYPEPRWLSMIQHDMMMWDHGMPRLDGTLAPEQRPEADFNIEFQSHSKMADQSMKLALVVKLAADKYTTDYPGTLGPHMTATDSRRFQNIVPTISMRENERGMNIGAGWNPHWHQVTDLYSTFSDKDFKLGLNAGQATLAAIAQLTGAHIRQQ